MLYTKTPTDGCEATYCVGKDFSELSLSAHGRLELCKMLSAHTTKAYVAPTEEGAYLICPALYPSTGVTPVLKLCGSEEMILQLLDDLQTGGKLCFEKKLLHKRRHAAIGVAAAEGCTVDIGRAFKLLVCQDFSRFSSLSGAEKYNSLVLAAECMASLLGLSLNISGVGELCERKNAETDPMMFCAIVFALFCELARVGCTDSVDVHLGELDGGLSVEVFARGVCAERAADLNARISPIKRIAYDKNIFWESVFSDDGLKITFSPLRYELSLLGIKQENR